MLLVCFGNLISQESSQESSQQTELNYKNEKLEVKNTKSVIASKVLSQNDVSANLDFNSNTPEMFDFRNSFLGKDNLSTNQDNFLQNNNFLQPNNFDSISTENFTENPDLKSPYLAGLLSFTIPGAGQIYNNSSLWRTALYLTLEVVSWFAFYNYQKKGDQATSDFENFADRHWDIERYINWISDNYKNWSNEEVEKSIVQNCLDSIFISKDPNIKSYERVNFEQLHRLERAIKPFSHTLYNHGEQQYYEMIGKYSQYRAGWDDHNASLDTNKIYDPSFTSTNNTDYTYQRANANKILGYTNLAIAAVILNHLGSGIDAIVTANSNNKLHFSTKSEVKINQNFQYDLSTSFTLKINF